MVDRVPQVDPEKNRFGAIRVDTLREILANKLTTLVSRTELKDLIDLYYLEKAGHDVLRAGQMGSSGKLVLEPASSE